MNSIKQNKSYRAVLVFCLCLLCNIIYGKDAMQNTLYIEEIIKTKNAQGELSSVKKGFYSSDFVLIIDQSLPYKTLFDMKKKKVTLLDDAKKRYGTCTFEKFRKLSENGPYAALSDKDIVIEKSNRQKKIGDYDCSESILFIPKYGIKTYMWNAKLPVPLHLFYAFSEKTGLGTPFSSMARQLKAGGQYTVESETVSTTAMTPAYNIKVRVSKIRVEDLPNSFYAVPKGFSEDKGLIN